MRGMLPIGAFGTRQRSAETWFAKFASMTAYFSGRPVTFIIATLTVVVWGVTGPLFNYSDTWQLVINTSTTIITFLMVFLIQNTQNRDTTALQLKLDELIIATKGAPNSAVAIEESPEEELSDAKKDIRRRADKVAA